MHWLLARVYDRLLEPLENSGLRAWRGRLLESLSGNVLEVGAGTGLNLAHYPKHSVRLVLTEPDDNMRNQLLRRLGTGHRDSVLVASAFLEKLPFADASFESVVATLVLCSVRDLRNSLQEVHRVLLPGGRFLFIEHVAAEDNPALFRWQRRLEPFWKFVGGNCHLTRSTAQAVLATGFEIQEIERAEFPAAALAQPLLRGVAVKSETDNTT